MNENTYSRATGFPIKQPLSVISLIDSIMFRIKYAEIHSPIAVFLHYNRPGLVAVFGSTVKTKKIAIKQNQYFVGMYDRTSDPRHTAIELNSALADQWRQS